MSGALVGEVLDAAEAGHLDSLSRGDVLALIAVAEKCHTTTRQGSVRMSRIQALMGASRATAWRAMRRLKDRGLIRVVKRGYKAHGVGHANVYELAEHVSPNMKHTTAGACLTQGETCQAAEHVSFHAEHVSNSAEHVSKPAIACFTQGETHDGLYDGLNDGLNDGRDARKRATPPRGTRLPTDWKPPPELVAQQRDAYPHLDLDEILEDFRDYWQAKTGKDATKLDWPATWRRWVRKEASQTRRADPQAGPTTYERKTARNLAVYNSLADNPPKTELEQ
jgi:hypothetical protein